MDANWVLAGVTAVLVIITWSYARQTKRMADVMFRDYQIRVRPILTIWLGGSGHTLKVTVKSHSLYPVQMTKVRIHFRFQGKEYDDEKDYPLAPHLDKVIKPDGDISIPVAIDWGGVRKIIPGLPDDPFIPHIEVDCSLFFFNAEGKETKTRRGCWQWF